jgi:hypothetical protein
MPLNTFGMIKNSMATYNFYVRMDGDTYGPYTAKQVVELELLDDVLVTEESMDGQWLPASKFNFEDMVRKESEVNGDIGASAINEYGEFHRPSTLNDSYQSSQNTQRTGFYSSSSGHSIYSNQNSELNKWNWGAFFFNWIWGVSNGVYWPLIFIVVNFIPYVGGIISLIICILLGINGNQMAWKAKQGTTTFDSFIKTQKKWSQVGLWAFCICLILGVLIGIAAAF